MDNLLSITRVLETSTQSKSTLYRNIKLGNFPAPVRVSQNRVAWRQADVNEWLNSRKAGGISHG